MPPRVSYTKPKIPFYALVMDDVKDEKQFINKSKN